MLRRLKVENYALIDRLELELDDRLNIITGETGAGKSILLGALGLLLGNKNDNATLKDDKRNCLIEGVFDLGTRDLQAFFDRNDLDYSRETTLTRQITPAGKSRSFINDTPVPLALLRELGSQLIDIHSQHQNVRGAGAPVHHAGSDMPAIRSEDLVPGGAGVRALALRRDGTLEDDFVLAPHGRIVHVLNAPSPAATASLAIGGRIAEAVAAMRS